MSTLKSLGVKEELIRASKSTIRAFDSSKSEIVGEIEFDVTIGPTEFLIRFQVLNIPASFGLLLGRPWIYTARVVPSSLHQKVKMVIDNKLVTICGETDYLACQIVVIPHVGLALEEELNFHAFEWMSIMHVQVGTMIKKKKTTISLSR